MKSAIKIRLYANPEEAKVLDRQSAIMNWLYNRLVERANELRDAYRRNPSKEIASVLYTKRGLRNLIPGMKVEHPFLKTVHSSPLKNAGLRVSESIQAYQKSRKGERKGKKTGWPRFRSRKVKFFSLLYDEPKKGFRVDGNTLSLSLGTDEDGKRFKLLLKMEKGLSAFGNPEVLNIRIKEQAGVYYAVFTVIRPQPESRSIKKVIALDPNHKNLAYGYDTEGKATEFHNPWFLKILERRIDQIKSRRDRCQKKSVKVTRENGSFYFKPSKRWRRFNEILQNLYNKRREQTNSFLYTIANRLCKEYDLIAIGDYTPRGGGINKGMRRAMNNESVIGRFKHCVSWICMKSGKSYTEWDEKGSTRTCSYCKTRVEGGLSPDIREWTCGNADCGRSHIRDENAARNGLIRTLKKNEFPCSGRLSVPLEVTERRTLRYNGLGLCSV